MSWMSHSLALATLFFAFLMESGGYTIEILDLRLKNTTEAASITFTSRPEEYSEVIQPPAVALCEKLEISEAQRVVETILAQITPTHRNRTVFFNLRIMLDECDWQEICTAFMQAVREFQATEFCTSTPAGMYAGLQDIFAALSDASCPNWRDHFPFNVFEHDQAKMGVMHVGDINIGVNGPELGNLHEIMEKYKFGAVNKTDKALFDGYQYAKTMFECFYAFGQMMQGYKQNLVGFAMFKLTETCGDGVDTLLLEDGTSVTSGRTGRTTRTRGTRKVTSTARSDLDSIRNAADTFNAPRDSMEVNAILAEDRASRKSSLASQTSNLASGDTPKSGTSRSDSKPNTPAVVLAKTYSHASMSSVHPKSDDLSTPLRLDLQSHKPERRRKTACCFIC